MTTLALVLSLTLTATPAPEQFISELQSARQSGDFAGAARLADACVAANPTSLGCLREAALLWLRLSEKEESANARLKAVGYLERYVKLAPTNDRFVEKAKSILEHSK